MDQEERVEPPCLRLKRPGGKEVGSGPLSAVVRDHQTGIRQDHEPVSRAAVEDVVNRLRGSGLRNISDAGTPRSLR